jgi:hypothetical protein
LFTFLWYRCAKRHFFRLIVFNGSQEGSAVLFPQKKVTKENSRLRLPLLLLVLLVGSVLTEPDDAGFEVNNGLCF